MTPYDHLLDCASEALARRWALIHVMAINQRSYEADQVAAALTLAEQGWSTVKIGQELDIPWSTVRNWLKQPEAASKHNEAITAGRRLVALRTMERVHKMLDQDEAGEINLSPTQVMVNFGIAQDKHQADLKIAAAAEAPTIQRGPFVIFMGQSVQHQEAPAIEATVTVLPPAPAPDAKAEPEPEP